MNIQDLIKYYNHLEDIIDGDKEYQRTNICTSKQV